MRAFRVTECQEVHVQKVLAPEDSPCNRRGRFSNCLLMASDSPHQLNTRSAFSNRFVSAQRQAPGSVADSERKRECAVLVAREAVNRDCRLINSRSC